MSKIRREHSVTFYSPGMLFAESSSVPIDSWSPALAVGLAEKIVERYGAKPYGFRFETHIVADAIPDGEGGTLEVKPRPVTKSGLYFLGGRIETIDVVNARAAPDESILRSSMLCNGYWIVCVNTNSYKSVHPFEETDFIVDAAGAIVERGDSPFWKEYRARMQAQRDKENAAHV
jgi:hypothetical protein